jgi:hypothetical protein
MKSLKLTTLAALLIAIPASAGSFAGVNGRAMSSSDVACFSEATSGGIKNTCAGNKNWWMPIANPRTSTGSVTIKASANGTCTGAPGTVCVGKAPTCTARHARASGSLVTFKSATLSSVINTPTTIGTFDNVGTTDILYMYCTIAGSDTVGALGLMSVTW